MNAARQFLETVNIESVKTQRRKNAAALINSVFECNGILPLIQAENLGSTVPLYVPILVHAGEQRESLRHYLNEKGIFCPVVWPETVGAKKGFREKELSLVCDQRYSEDDMAVITDSIKEWNSMSMQ